MDLTGSEDLAAVAETMSGEEWMLVKRCTDTSNGSHDSDKGAAR